LNNKNPVKTFDEQRSGIYATSIEIIFAIIVSLSFFTFYQELVPLSLDFESTLILVSLCTVLASLVGYLDSIKKRPHKNLKRFVVDLVVLYFYFQLLYSPGVSFEYFLQLYPIIFGLYLAWQYFEHKSWRNRFFRSNGYTIPFFAAFLGLYLYYQSLPQKIQAAFDATGRLQYNDVGNTEWLILLFVFLLVIGFRIASYFIKVHQDRKIQNSKISK